MTAFFHVSAATFLLHFSRLLFYSSHYSFSTLFNIQNVAFVSFLTFATVQLFFAIFYAKSQSMMADCAAMYVDVLSYLVNFWAERLKHGSTKMSPRQLRLHRLYLELLPPFSSVVTLVVVTVMALQEAIETLIQEASSSGHNNDLNKSEDNDDDDPDLSIMMAFSGLNLILDLVNVGYFVKAAQAIGIGLPNQRGEEHVHVEYERYSSRHNSQHDRHYHCQRDDNTANQNGSCRHSHRNGTTVGAVTEQQRSTTATEETPLVIVREDADSKELNESSESSSECESEGASVGRNLNMCSAWTVRYPYLSLLKQCLVVPR
jgi:Cation efflux family